LCYLFTHQSPSKGLLNKRNPPRCPALLSLCRSSPSPVCRRATLRPKPAFFLQPSRHPALFVVAPPFTPSLPSSSSCRAAAARVLATSSFHPLNASFHQHPLTPTGSRGGGHTGGSPAHGHTTWWSRWRISSQWTATSPCSMTMSKRSYLAREPSAALSWRR
jgi:hypothetical protein